MKAKRRGRPTDDPKVVRFELRLSATDAALLDALVERSTLPDRTSVLRLLIREATTKSGVVPGVAAAGERTR